jgi:hypothetical protein
MFDCKFSLPRKDAVTNLTLAGSIHCNETIMSKEEDMVVTVIMYDV